MIHTILLIDIIIVNLLEHVHYNLEEITDGYDGLEPVQV